MRGILFRWAIVTVTIMLLPYVVPGVEVSNIWAALAAAAVLGVLNAVVKPVLFILTLPLTVLTLGLFLLVLNGIILYFAGAVVAGFEIAGLGSAIFASLIISLVSWITHVSWQTEGGHRVFVVRDARTGTHRRMRDLN